MRIYDEAKIHEALIYLQHGADNVDHIEWLNNPDNIVLENEQGDIALFEHGC